MARGHNEGTISKRTDGRWQARLTLPDGTRRAFYAKTRNEAAAKLHDAQQALKQALPVPGGRETLAQFLGRYLTDVAPKRVTAATLTHYRGDARLYIIPALGRLKLSEVTPARVQAMLNGLATRGLGPSTERHCRAVLRVALGQAQREGRIGQNAAKLVPRRAW